jgi:GH25 family lysozyme M1 (1,4-beta-N-acetylmuramidase)
VLLPVRRALAAVASCSLIATALAPAATAAAGDAVSSAPREPIAPVSARPSTADGHRTAHPMDPYANADEHYAGSQIAKYEGGLHGKPPKLHRPLGNDVSGWQGEVNWYLVSEKGAKFSYVKATEGTGYRNPHFSQQYDGAARAGLIRGAYHFARPDLSGGGTQAKFFVRHGGQWRNDGRTLPGALDMEYNPYGTDKCYGLTQRQMRSWIRAFVRVYADRTGRLPVIYTSTSWWKLCTGNSGAFAHSPLWIARYNTYIGALPKGWERHTFWQFSDSGSLPGDQNYFHSSMRTLRRLATGW